MDILNVLLEISIYSAVIFFAVMLIKKVFKKQMSPILHYALWALLIIRLIMPVTIASSLKLVVIPLEQQTQQTVQNPGQAGTSYENDFLFAQDDSLSAADSEAQPGQPMINADTSTAAQTELAAAEAAGSNVSSGIDTTELLLIVWLGGVAAAGIYIAAAYAVTKKRIVRSSLPVPAKVIQMFVECKNEMGIKRQINIAGATGIASPALFFPGTVLLPVDKLMSMSDTQIRFALRHELMHYKRRDHIVSFGLVLLQAVYWFNPFVWLAFRQIRFDMEVACDNKVVGELDKTEKMAYASTVLSMFSGQKRFAVMLGMAMANTKNTAEKRIRGIFAKNRSSGKARVSALVLAAVLLVTCFTTACQPTPEKPFVQSKDNDTVEAAIDDYQSQDREPEVINTFSAPGAWQSQARDDVKNIDLYIDASVNVPTDTWGLYELRPIEPSLDDIQKMLSAIVGDATIYGEQTVRSKEYLLEKITHLEAQKTEFERLLNEGGLSEDEKLAQEAENGTKGTSGPVGEDGYSDSMLMDEELQLNIEHFTQMINEAKALLPTAPDEDTVVKHEFVPADMFRMDLTKELAQQSGFSYQQEGGSVAMSLNGTADTGKQNPADIYIGLYRGDYNHFSLNFADYDDYEHSFSSEDSLYTGQELFKCDISMEDAAQTAMDKVSEMGFDYLDIDSTFISGMLDRKRMENDRFPECFEFVFTRKMDGATATNAKGDGVWTDEKEMALEYAPHWEADEVKIYVDDSGIVGVRVDTLKSEVVRQAYGIELKDFEEIMDIFETQLFIKNAYSGPGDSSQVISREIHVSEIRLGYMPTAWKDHSGQIIFIPVWDFFGDETVTFEDGIGGDLGSFLDENNRFYRSLGVESLLTINALDGTIMIRP